MNIQTIINEYEENLEKGSLFLYITFWESLWIYNIKLITIILLAFAIPFSGYATIIPSKSTPFYIGLSSGINFTKLNNNEFHSEYRQSPQFSFNAEFILADSTENQIHSMYLSWGYYNRSYYLTTNDEKKLNIESGYMALISKYQYTILNRNRKSNVPISLLVGGFLNVRMDEESNYDNTNYIDEDGLLARNNYGLLIGTKIEYVSSSDYSIFIEYNFGYDFSTLEKLFPSTNSFMHIINLGFKFPSTIF